MHTPCASCPGWRHRRPDTAWQDAWAGAADTAWLSDTHDPATGSDGTAGRYRGSQNASSGNSITSVVVVSAIRRSAARRGSTVAAKKRAAAIFPS